MNLRQRGNRTKMKTYKKTEWRVEGMHENENSRNVNYGREEKEKREHELTQEKKREKKRKQERRGKIGKTRS